MDLSVGQFGSTHWRPHCTLRRVRLVKVIRGIDTVDTSQLRNCGLSLLRRFRMYGPAPRFIPPDEDCFANGAKYFCYIERGSRGRNGAIVDEGQVERWRYTKRRRPSGWGWRNPFNKPDFILLDNVRQVEVVIRRATFIPPAFHVIEHGRAVGRIWMITPLRNKYVIQFRDGATWTFRMPLYSVLFRGDAPSRPEVWVYMGPSEACWNILIRPGIDDSCLVPVVAFLHNERWLYG